MRILIVRLSSMGDVVHALPLARNSALAGAEVGWAIEPSFSGLLEGDSDVARVFLADTRAWRRRAFAAATRREIGRLAAEARAFAPDFVLDPQGLFKSAIVARLAHAPIVGFSARARREPLSALLAGVRVEPDPRERHVVDRNLALLAPAGIPIRERSPDVRHLLRLPRPAAEDFVAKLPDAYAVLHPGAARSDKTWGEERFARLAQALAGRGIATVVSWGPGDAARAARLAALVPDARRPPLLDFAGLARLCARARLFVGGDTGPLHLADAVGTATVALFGPTDPQSNGPYRFRDGIVADMRNVSDDTMTDLALRIAGG